MIFRSYVVLIHMDGLFNEKNIQITVQLVPEIIYKIGIMTPGVIHSMV